MTPALLADVERPPSLFGEPESSERTLEDVVADAWAGVRSHRTVACPLCDGALVPRYSAGAAPVGARCRDCGTELS
jgi:hypothetical protein